MKNSYKSYVLKARKLISEVESYQYKIAEMAILACENKKHSLADFARDIEVPRRTVLTWVHIYKQVIEKLGIKNPTATDWAKAAKVHKFIMNEKKREKDGRTKTHLPKRRVVQLFNKVDDPEQNQFLEIDRALSSSKHIEFKIKSLNLDKAPRNHLLELMYSLSGAASYLNNFLIQEKKAS